MSKLLKSKYLLGALVVAIMFVGVVVVSDTASADTCTFTKTLRVGSKGDEVKCLQAAVGVTADGSFGPITKAAVQTWQTSKGLVVDGIFGAKSQAAFTGVASTTSGTLPAGCTSTAGYSPTTGTKCDSVVAAATTTLPAGCTSTAGYSPTTGVSCATGVTTTTTTTNPTGPVSVAIATDTPASGYIVGGQATADLAHFTFTGTGTVNTIMLKRGGISDQNTLSSLYLYEGANRLTDGYSFNNVGELTMNSLGIAVAGSRTISVKADVAVVTNASSLSITLTSFTAAGGTATTANVKGNEMTYGTGNLASVYLATQASVAVLAASVNAGTSAYTVWSAPVQVNTRAVWLKGANFRMVGSAPVDALGNIKLYVDGVSTGATATVTSITGSNYATFDFSASPISLSTGTHTVDVRADVVKGSNYMVTVSIQQASDLVLFDAQVGVNLAAAVSATVAFAANTAGTITILAGSASVVADPTFNSLTNITGGSTNATIAKFKVHGYGEDVKVSSILITPLVASATAGTCTSNSSGVTTAGTCGLNNVTIYFNGSQVGSSQTLTSAGMGSVMSAFSLGSQMILPAGADSYIEVRADLQTTGSVNYTAGSVSANLIVNTTSNGQGQNSKATLNFPTGTVTGTVLTIQTGTLAVSKNTGYANTSVNPNITNVKAGSFTLQNQSSSESVRVTSLTVTLFDSAGTAMTATSTPALTNFSNLRTSETSGSGANPIQPAASNVFSVDFTLAPGATKVIDVLTDTGAYTTSPTNTFTVKLVATSLGLSSNVPISQNGNGTAVTGQTITLATGTVTNPPTLTAATSTSQQFVPASGGATDATKATFKISATGGAATISELKFTVNSQDFSSAGTYSAITTGTGKVFTPTTAAQADRFAVGDSVQIVASTTNGLGTVTSISAATSVTVAITVAATGTGSALRLVPSTVTAVRVGNVSAAPVSGIAYLTGLNLTVPNGGSGLSQEVFISYAPAGTNGVSTGSTSRVALESIKYSSGGTTSTLCTAAIATCGTVLAAGGVTAPTMKIVGSSPSISVTASGSTLVPGTVEVARVTVAATKGSITLNALPISVSIASAQLTAGGGGANGIVVKDANNNPVTTTNSAFSSTTAGGTSIITFTSGYEIATTQTFKIYLVVDSTNFNGSTPVAHAATVSTGLGNADLLSWTDTAGDASTTTGLDVAGSAVTTLSNRYLNGGGGGGTTTPGFFYNFPTTTVSVSS